MKKLPKTIYVLGRVWIWLAVSLIVLLYFFNLIFSQEPISHRILVFINIWNVFIALLIILPGYLLTEAAEKIAIRNGDSFNKTIDGNRSKIISFLTKISKSKIFLMLAVIGYLLLMILFVNSHSR